MPVIINEFEAVVEPPQRTEPELAAPPRPEAEPPCVSPLDLEDILRQRLERLARLVAD